MEIQRSQPEMIDPANWDLWKTHQQRNYFHRFRHLNKNVPPERNYSEVMVWSGLLISEFFVRSISGEGEMLGTADQGQEGADQAARGAQDWAAQSACG